MSGSSSRSNTGIGFLDNAVDATVKGIAGGAKNIERNTQNYFNSVGALGRGDFNNYGQTMGQNFFALASMGLINPEDNKNLVGENNIQRKISETEAAQRDAEIADAANQIAEQNRSVESTIAGIVGAKKRSPGKAQTLLGTSSSGQLLQYKGKA